MGKGEEDQDFNKYGPRHLKHVNWRVLDQRMAVVSSLVNGVYVRQVDCEKKRTHDKALGLDWWEFFHFSWVKDLIDGNDESIIGVTFKYNHPEQCRSPKYVVAIRGTSLNWKTALEDLSYDCIYALNLTSKSARYQTVLEEVRDLVKEVGPQNVWVAGHSLGAAISLQVGKTMAREGYHIDAYLFNPPFWSLPLKLVQDFGPFRFGIRFGKDFIKAGLYHHLKDTDKPVQHYDQFAAIRSWLPYLFVNEDDMACCEYISYFRHRKIMRYMGLSWLAKIASPNSLTSLIFGVLGENTEPVHLIPSAHIVKNMHYSSAGSHSLSQWWDPETKCDTKCYIMK